MINVIIRCDAGKHHQVGTGHVTRCISLAKSLIKSRIVKHEDVCFLTRDFTGYEYGKKIISKEKLKYKTISKVSKLEILEFNNLYDPNSKNIAIFDTFKLNSNLIIKVKEIGYKILIFDEFAKHLNLAHLSIGSLYLGKKKTNLYSGYNYLILSREIYKKSIFRKKIKNIVVTFGGVDKRKLTNFFLTAIPEIPLNININIILGQSDKRLVKLYRSKIEKYNLTSKIKLFIYPKNFQRIIKKADIGVTSGGLSLFEFAAYGIPTISLPQYRHQLNTINNLRKFGITFLGSNKMKLNKLFFQKVLNNLITDSLKRNKINKMAPKFIDGKGLKRIKKLIYLKLMK